MLLNTQFWFDKRSERIPYLKSLDVEIFVEIFDVEILRSLSREVGISLQKK